MHFDHFFAVLGASAFVGSCLSSLPYAGDYPPSTRNYLGYVLLALAGICLSLTALLSP